MPPLYFLRHGETEWNRAGRLQGHLDSPLTEKGRNQAALMASILLRELGPRPALRLVSSPLGRARQTAGFVSEALGLSLETDPQLAELTMGSWDGLTRPEVEARWPGRLTGATDHDWYFRSPDGETVDEARKRASAWLQSVTQPTIAVAHGFFGKILRGVYAGLDHDAALHQSEPQDVVFRLHNRTIERLTSNDIAA
ncbi:histidine phosphatase family protein [Microvirga terricola]|uniref:Histidine phosphatase family protein n=1 Tax=Microvirga terricola TaxID=2719797 RepID=A0ABX0V6Z8_9HYPH|nr:histidine phosphatase family protein [Microvirga terricola]NIX75584.1 histidine phosphatase family protein [Microvirga terricola]